MLHDSHLTVSFLLSQEKCNLIYVVCILFFYSMASKVSGTFPKSLVNDQILIKWESCNKFPEFYKHCQSTSSQLYRILI